MPKFKILITDDPDVRFQVQIPEEWPHNFESRAEATKAYHEIISKLEDQVNKAQETLNALVENGHIVEVEDNS